MGGPRVGRFYRMPDNLRRQTLHTFSDMGSAQVHLEEDAWVRREREKVVAYLTSQRCDHGGIAEWPAFHVDPYVALWAIQSRTVAGRVGWWAISGDLPKDYEQ